MQQRKSRQCEWKAQEGEGERIITQRSECSECLKGMDFQKMAKNFSAKYTKKTPVFKIVLSEDTGLPSVNYSSQTCLVAKCLINYKGKKDFGGQSFFKQVTRTHHFVVLRELLEGMVGRQVRVAWRPPDISTGLLSKTCLSLRWLLVFLHEHYSKRNPSNN